MAPEPSRGMFARAFAFLGLALLLAAPAHALRIVNYNITNYPGTNPFFSTRQPMFRLITASLNADVLVAQEVQSQAGVDSFRTNVLNVNEPGQWASAPFFNGNDTDNALFYKPSKVTLLGSWHFYPNPANLLRVVSVYRLQPVGYANTELRIYSQHLKASTGSANEAQRFAEAQGIRDSMNAAPPGTAMILTGDFNIYRTSEAAYKHFLRSLADNDGRLYDPYNPLPDTTITFNGGAPPAWHTQCPCLTCPAGSGFSGGGLDDRFDMFLPTYGLKDGVGLDLIAGTYVPVGNDGLHFNLNITDAPTIPEGSAFATALWTASDHLPIRTDLRLPAQLGAPSVLAFGTVITGASASLPLTVTNLAIAPADTLRYTIVSGDPSAFVGPAGIQKRLPSVAGDDVVQMLTAAPGPKFATLTLADPNADPGVRTVTASGTVLRHASPSLDSLAALTTALLDFGTHTTGAFPVLDARVHNRGYDALQAQLRLTGAAITGGAGRFSLVGGFTPASLAGTGRSHAVAFDDAGATADSTYEATLTFTSADEALPGATAQADLTLTLRARLDGGGPVGVPGATPPTATLLFAPAPNPLLSSSVLRFDLARASRVTLEVYDVNGRRVAGVLDRALEAGRYAIEWPGRADGGAPLRAGLYFVRMSVPGLAAQNTRLAVVR